MGTSAIQAITSSLTMALVGAMGWGLRRMFKANRQFWNEHHWLMVTTAKNSEDIKSILAIMNPRAAEKVEKDHVDQAVPGTR